MTNVKTRLAALEAAKAETELKPPRFTVIFGDDLWAESVIFIEQDGSQREGTPEEVADINATIQRLNEEV